MSAYQTSQVKVTNVLDGEQTYQATEALLSADVKSQAKSATPAKTPVVVTPDEGYLLSEVDVAAVTSDIDDNIQATNIKAGVEILGVTGTLQPDKPDQEKTVTPKTTAQTVVADAGYELAKVTVNATPLQAKTVTPTTSQQTIAPEGSNIGLSSVVVSAIQTETKTITANGTYTPSTGKFFDQVTVNVAAIAAQQKTVDVTTNGTTEVTPDTGKALSKVTINTNVPQSIPEDVATEAALTAKLVAANLGKAYRYTGTTGTYTNGNIYVVEEA